VKAAISGFCSISALVIALAGSAAAMAQTDTTADTVAEIVVTAQKRAEPTQKVPISIEAVSGAALAEVGVDDLVAAQKLAPGIVFSIAPDEGVQLTFRGLGTPARNKSFEQSVGAFADGVFYGHPNMYAIPFFDVERIEFIAGTQSTLLGKNTSVGAISIVSRKPGDELGGTVSGGREFEDGGWRLDGAVDLPLSDVLKVRIAGHFKDQNGWLRNDLTDQTAPHALDGAGRIVASFTPGAVKITGIYEYADVKRTGTEGQIVTDSGVFHALDGQTYPATLGSHTRQYTSHGYNGDGYNNQKLHLATLIADVPWGEHTLTSQTAYAHLSAATVNPLSAPPEEIFADVPKERFSQVSQEIRLTSPAGQQLDYILGLYYFHSDETSLDTQYWSVPDLFVAPGVQLLNGDFVNNFHQKLNSYSAFGNTTIRLNERMRIAGGVRYTNEEKDVLFGRSTLGALTFWNTVANPPFPVTPLTFHDGFVNGNGNFQYDLTSTIMAYVSYGVGTKSGGFADSATVADANPAVSARIKSETAKTSEAGLKSTWFDRKLLVNVAAFYTNVENYQVTYFDSASGAFINLNTPARSRGFETRTQMQLARGFEINGAVTYANATAGATATTPPQRLVSAPLWTYQGGARYERPAGANLLEGIGVSGHYRSSIYTQFDESARDGGFGTVDANIFLAKDNDRWRVTLSTTNLFNAKGADFGADGGIDPRLTALNPGMRFRFLDPLRTVELSFALKY
jgi:iron complex outermembrane recepter protein